MSLPKPDSTPLRRGSVRALGALSVSVMAVPLVGGTADAASVPLPQPSRTLPSGLDVTPPYQRGVLCLNESQPGPIAFAKLLNATYGSHTYGVLRKCDQEHGEGRALDWMLNASNSKDLAIGNAVTRWLAASDSKGRPAAMARRFGINYMIWNRQIWKAWDPGRGWQPYTGSSPHTDHIHISFTWDGAYKRTSWWTGVPVVDYLTGPRSGGSGTSTPASSDPADYVNVTLRLGSSGQAVRVLQKAIGGLTVDGSFGPATDARVREYQRSKGLTVNGVVDSRVWNAIIGRSGTGSGGGTSGSGSTSADPATLAKYAGTVLRRGSRGTAVSVMQKAIGGIAVDGSFGPATEARVRAYQRSKGLTATGVVDSRVWNALMGKGTSGSGTSGSTASGLARYADTVLSRGSRGTAVSVLQKAIGGIAVDGSFGPATEARVKAYQRSKGLTATGVVDGRVWNALMGKGTSGSGSTGSSTTGGSLAQYSGLTLRLWSRGEAVKAMQRAIGGLTVDGSFGPATLARVKAWQQSKGLAVDGVVDRRDWAVLAGGSAGTSGSSSSGSSTSGGSSSGSSSAVATTELTRYKGTTLRRGSTGAAVRALQDALGGLSVDGRFGPATEARVEAVQRAGGLSATGVVDGRTWDVVERRAHPLLPYWGTVLKRGSRGSAVVALQRALRITADGSFGPQTETAVKGAQRAARIAQTGVVGTVTWKAVEARMR
ncbi:peptidoglycan-binding domain-containing protein [Phycicoccus flavus]|uniref:peptidoglycan-binding domain-containing protein n=1 Tax=Phycicoccus flavus TaxID=2502783 RepID=UPI000FEB9872|nr:peptidoglycan-binding protein [Phycicoccus flavus]NHA68005.1 peptidoglycan-binding protein [Phycicoccus flavus]